jgi:hypothetical protein
VLDQRIAGLDAGADDYLNQPRREATHVGAVALGVDAAHEALDLPAIRSSRPARQSPKPIPRSRAVRIVSQSVGTRRMPRVTFSSGT